MGQSATTVLGHDGVASAVHDFGGTGPVLFFTHATGMHGWVWKPIADYLADRAHCVAIDLRGHGDSPVPAGADLSWRRFGSDVLAAVNSLGAEGVIGVGHSLGAAALLMAEVEAPGTFEHLFLYEPAMHAGLDEDEWPALLAVRDAMVTMAGRRRATFASRAEALSNYRSKPPMAQFEAAVLEAYVRHGFIERDQDGAQVVELKCLPTIEAQIYAGSFAHDTAEYLTAVRCPVTLAMGSGADPPQRRSVERLAAQFDSVPIVVPGVDHFGPMQQPKQFADLITQHVLDS